MQVDIKNKNDLDISSLNFKKEIKHKGKKMHRFLSLFQYMRHFLSFPEKSTPLNEFEQRANYFLHSKNYQAYCSMLKQGYIPNEQQQQRVDNLVQDLFFNRVTATDGYGFDLTKDIETLENMLSYGYQLKEKDVFIFIAFSNNNFLKHNKRFFQKGSNLFSTTLVNKESFPILSSQIKTIIHTDRFINELSDFFYSELFDKKIKYEHTILKFNFLLDVAPELLLKKVSFEQFLSVNTQLQKKSTWQKNANNIQLMNNIINHYYSPNMKSLYRDIKKTYTTSFVEDLLLNKVKTQIEALKEIPVEALNIIEAIEKIYNTIEKKENSTEFEQLAVILDQRIPDILSKYLSIDPEYRTTLKNTQQLNAEDLMIASLKDIHVFFNTISIDLNQDLVNSLSATSKYAKSLSL